MEHAKYEPTCLSLLFSPYNRLHGPCYTWDPQTLKWVLRVFHRLRIETFFSSIILCFSCEQTWLNSYNWTSKISSRKKCIWGRERFFPKYFFFSVCFYLVLPLPSREGVQCNSFAHVISSGGLLIAAICSLLALTVYLLHQLNQSKSRKIWVSHFQA